MHISTTTLCITLLSIFGGSKTAHADQNEDGFGVTNYGIQCFGRVYPKHAIYAAAKNYCDINKRIPNFSDLHSAALGFQTRFYYYFTSKTDINNLLKTTHHILPILEDGTLYPLDLFLRKKSAGKKPIRKTDEKDPGPDRLVIDNNCNIIGAFSDFYYTPYKIEDRVEECKILKSALNILSPSIRSPERSPQQSPPRSHEQSPPRSREQSPPRSREQSPPRSREQSPPRSREQSPERFPEISSGESIYHSLERFPERFSESSL